MSKIKKILLTFFAFLLLTVINSNVSKASLYLDELKFDVTLNEDGSMDVIEIWNIDISETNTLFKTFKIDKSKYDSITNVTVSEEISDSTKEYIQIFEEMYHVTTGSYYALINSNKMFEIAWGTGMENKSGHKKYVIKYRVNNAINLYNDCSELYWQFVGKDFEIDADKVQGTIHLPQNIETQEDIKVWAHGDLNGEINIISENEVEFKLNNFNAGTYIEPRIVMPKNAFPLSEKIENIDKKDDIIAEELEWAKEADRIRQRSAFIRNVILIIATIITSGLSLFLIKKLIKNKKALAEAKEIKPEFEFDYFREIPNENSTPGEAAYLYNLKSNAMMFDTSKVFSATLLNLCLKKYISFEVNGNGKNSKNILVNLNQSSNIEDLKEDEKIVYELLQKVQKKYGENNFTMKDFEKYAQNNSSSFASKIQELRSKAFNQQVEEGNIDLKIKEKYSSWSRKMCVIFPFRYSYYFSCSCSNFSFYECLLLF